MTSELDRLAYQKIVETKNRREAARRTHEMRFRLQERLTRATPERVLAAVMALLTQCGREDTFTGDGELHAVYTIEIYRLMTGVLTVAEPQKAGDTDAWKDLETQANDPSKR